MEVSAPRFRPNRLVIIVGPVRRSKFKHWAKVRLAAFSLVVALTLITASQPLPTPINITWGQYNEALEKWNNLQVTDYEETVRDGLLWPGQRWKLVVHVDRTSANPSESVTHFDRRDASTVDSPSAESLELLTIRQAFRGLAEYMKHPDDPAGISDVNPRLGNHLDVYFDQAPSVRGVQVLRQSHWRDIHPRHFDHREHKDTKVVTGGWKPTPALQHGTVSARLQS
jgi:hypothetical protein